MKPEQFSRAWSKEEEQRLVARWEQGARDAELGAEFGRTVHAIACRRRKLGLVGDVDRWGRPLTGEKYRWWTKERVIEALADYAARNRGPLPTSDHVYGKVKKGHNEWPPQARVLEYFGSMADAWAAVPGTKGRFTRGWVAWTQGDDDYLLEHAGNVTLKRIAKALGRSWPACKRRLYDLQAGRARDVSGYMSALQVAKEYQCPADRVTRLIASGELKAHRVQGGHYWRIDPMDAEAVAAKLRAPRKTQKVKPLDVGDYRKRYGLSRTQGADGRMVERAVTPAGAAHLEEKRARRREREEIARLTRQLEAAGLVVDVRAAARERAS